MGGKGDLELKLGLSSPRNHIFNVSLRAAQNPETVVSES